MRRLLTLVMLFLILSNLGYSQSKFVVQNKRQSSRINFKLINNLIIIPVEINGVVLSFLLDTGVSKPIVFSFLNVSDTLKLKDTETIYLRGLGEGNSVKALKSKNNIFKIGDALKLNQDLYEIYDSNLNFAPRLGVPVHGIIGFDLFKDLVVEINYSRKYIRLTNPDQYNYGKCKKCEILNLEFYNNKPYVNIEVSVNKQNIPIKLLIDSGGSDALWLFEDDSLGIEINHPFFEDFLGYGLSGSIYGKRSTIDALILKSFVLENANVAYPDNTSIIAAKKNKDRNGTLAGNILKRFNVIIDYQKAIISFKKNSHFKEKFSYNKSGIELAHYGVRLVKEKEATISTRNESDNDKSNSNTKIILDTKYKFSLKPAYSIVELRKDSPAYNAGILINDVILSINGKAAHEYTLQQIIHMFYGDDDKHMKLIVDRDGIILTINFYLETPLKKRPKKLIT